MTKANDTRFQVELSPAVVSEIESLMKDCEMGTKKELFNNSLTLLQWAVGQVKKGNIIASIDEENERINELTMPVLMRVAALHPPKKQKPKVAAAMFAR